MTWKLAAGSLINARYRLEQELGAGAQGAARRATDTNEGSPCVLKFVFATGNGDLQRRRFRREFITSQFVARHPSVCRPLGVITNEIDPKQQALVLEYCPGRLLTSFLREAPLED